MGERKGETERGNEALLGVPIEIVVSIGHARIPISEIVRLDSDSVLRLDRSVDDLVDLMVGDRVFARGELEEVEEDGQSFLAVRIAEVMNEPGDRI